MLAWAIEKFGSSLAICSSLQAEGCALIDMAWRIDPAVRVFTIDTGRQPQETYELIDRIREKYGIGIEVFMPETTVGREDGDPQRQQSFLSRRRTCACSAARCARCCRCAAR